MNSDSFMKQYAPSSQLENQLNDFKNEFWDYKQEMKNLVDNIRMDLDWEPDADKRRETENERKYKCCDHYDDGCFRIYG